MKSKIKITLLSLIMVFTPFVWSGKVFATPNNSLLNDVEFTVPGADGVPPIQCTLHSYVPYVVKKTPTAKQKYAGQGQVTCVGGVPATWLLTVQLQRQERIEDEGSWRNYGVPVTDNKPQAFKTLVDTEFCEKTTKHYFWRVYTKIHTSLIDKPDASTWGSKAMLTTVGCEA